LQYDFERRRRDLGGDREEEFGAFAEFGFDPHLALHQGDQTLGDGETEACSTVFLRRG